MARRGIKGSDNVSEGRWQQEGREGGEVGGMVEEKGGHQTLYWHVKWWEASKTEGTNDLDRIFQFVCIGFYSNIQADNQN